MAADPSVHTVIINAEAVTDIDATTIDTVRELDTELSQSGIDLRLARVKTNVLDIMRRGGLEDVIGAEHFYITVRDGVKAYLKEVRGYPVADDKEPESAE